MRNLIIGYLLFAGIIPLGNYAEIKSCSYAQETLSEEIPDHISISLKMALLEKQVTSSEESSQVVKCEEYDLKKRLLMRINPLTKVQNIAAIVAAKEKVAQKNPHN
jgi:hypothetical protein